jgi:hypothetical protein
MRLCETFVIDDIQRKESFHTNYQIPRCMQTMGVVSFFNKGGSVGMLLNPVW